MALNFKYKDVFKGRHEKGFTLVELIVVIVILCLLIAAAVIAIDPITQIKKARDAKRIRDLTEMRGTLETYYNDSLRFPAQLSFGSSLTGANDSVYMKKIPRDPLCSWGDCSRDDYIYVVDPDGKWFLLFSIQEIQSTSYSQCKFTCAQIPNFSDYASRAGLDLSRYRYCVMGGDINTTYCPLYGQETPFSWENPANPTSTPTPVPHAGQSLPTPTTDPYQGMPWYYCGCDQGATYKTCMSNASGDARYQEYKVNNCKGECGAKLCDK
jgi:prepilin-type N-terminal cleavage/methylation domain-containing protein